MRHRKSGVKLNRSSSHRQAMFRNMVTSLLKYDRIKTTDVRAKELRRWADHIITLAKRGDVHARRQAMAIVREKAVVHKIFEEANDRFGKINGGYTRIVKIGKRPGDAASVSLIELVSADDRVEKKKATPKKKTVAPKIDAPKIKASSDKVATAEEAVDAQADISGETATENIEAAKGEAVADVDAAPKTPAEAEEAVTPENDEDQGAADKKTE